MKLGMICFLGGDGDSSELGGGGGGGFGTRTEVYCRFCNRSALYPTSLQGEFINFLLSNQVIEHMFNAEIIMYVKVIL
jgi:hypothetical protein